MFRIRNQDRVLNLAHPGGGAIDLGLDEKLGKQEPISNWPAPGFVLARDGRSTRAWKVPDVSYRTASLLVPLDRSRQVCAGFEDLVEQLPITVEGVDWILIHRLGAVARLNADLSDFEPPPMPHSWQRYWLIRRAVLSDDQRLYGAFFTIDGHGGSPFCGAAFRDRVKAMRLVGLDFEEIGWFQRPGDPRPLSTAPAQPQRGPPATE